MLNVIFCSDYWKSNPWVYSSINQEFHGMGALEDGKRGFQNDYWMLLERISHKQVDVSSLDLFGTLKQV